MHDDQEAVVEREIDETANHDCRYCSTVFCSTSAFATTCCPGWMPGDDLLHVAGQHLAARHFHAPEAARPPPARRPSRDRADAESRWPAPRRAALLVLAVEGRGDEHPEPHHPGILHFQPHLGGAQIADRESGRYCRSRALKTLSGIGVQMDVRVLAHVHVRQIVFVHVADDPDLGEVGDGEQVRRIVERLDARRRGHLLLGDHARNRAR